MLQSTDLARGVEGKGVKGGVRGGEWCVRGMGWVGREGVGCERKGKGGKGWGVRGRGREGRRGGEA